MGLSLQALLRPSFRRAGLLVLTFMLIVACSATAQAPLSQSTPPQTAPPVESFRDYVIGPQDLLRVSILESPELSREMRVNPDGTVGMPLLDRVRLQGLTLTEAENLLEQKYRDAAAKLLAKGGTEQRPKGFGMAWRGTPYAWYYLSNLAEKDKPATK